MSESAVTAAGYGTTAWVDAARLQQAATPDHGDFYAFGDELVGTLRAMERLARVLAGQVACYGDGRTLRDDEGFPPAARLGAAANHLHQLHFALSRAQTHANRFWSEIGHTAVEEA